MPTHEHRETITTKDIRNIISANNLFDYATHSYIRKSAEASGQQGL